MTEQEKNKVQDLIDAWIKEAEQIKDVNRQPKNGALLDGRKTGPYAMLTKKYTKLIEDRLGYKIWNKEST